MTIFVTLQLRVTLDSIRNSCDVWDIFRYFLRSAKTTAKSLRFKKYFTNICGIFYAVQKNNQNMPYFFAFFLRSAKYVKNICGISYAVQTEGYALSNNANFCANIYTSPTIPEFSSCRNTWDIKSTYNIASSGVKWSGVEWSGVEYGVE